MVDISFKFRMVSRAVLGLVLVGASAAWVQAQTVKTMLVEPPAPLLPQQIGRWVKAASPAAGGAAVTPARAADSAVLAEDGLQRSAHGVYHVEGRPAETIAVTASQFVDATGAHAAYSYYLRPGAQYRGPKIGDETGDGFLIRSGTTVVSAVSKASAASTNAMLTELVVHLPKVGGPKGEPPLLPTYLPTKGLKTETVKYALGPVSYAAMGGVVPGEIVGFDKAAEAVMARYEGEGTLTLFLYPTPQIAAIHLRLIEAEMRRQGTPAGTVMLRRQGVLVLLTTGEWKAIEAQRMVEGIHLRNELTWNRKMPLEFHSEVQKTYSLLASIAVFCGVGALASVVLGLFLGGGRAAIRLMQGKPAASEPEFLRIDLSGTSAKLQMDGGGTKPPR
ncbi:MAG: DUF6599 family protein [Edaphobacter sp.]